ncbi:hypothetical protein [Aquiflexum gelatinilyticum]|uniref:CBM-cenC domain-containing protein n=1 Tax=Aquiflexum gelatinilyticum TaxID=2961943 RepID=A0A9X2PBF9_9BACT|nr:hypothetical protein [Aquiflexum gelatinilyticum]MCR9015655.1 hypothetical protein [Aquiflexum gelatinilyticum]
MKRISLLIPIFALFISCTEDDGLPVNTQLLKNSDLESPDGSISPWVPVTEPGFNLGSSTEVFRSSKKSLFIENSDSLNTNSATWRQSYNGPMPSKGMKLVLRAHLKGDNIELKGPESNVFISIRVFPVEDSNGNTFGRYVTTQNQIGVSGTFEWTQLRLTLPNTPEEVDNIVVYLVMGSRTTGKIYFDDITLTVE